MKNDDKKQISEDFLDETIYTAPKKFYLKLFIASFSFIFIVLLYFIPIKDILTTYTEQALNSSPKCRIKHDKLSISLFLPTIKIENPTIPRGCLNDKTIKLKRITVKLTRPSFFPLGIKTTINVSTKQESVTADAILGLSKQIIRLDQEKLSSRFINLFLPDSLSIKGSFKIKMVLTHTTPNKITGPILIQSDNFQINSMNIQGLAVPALNLKTLGVKLNIKERKLFIHNITIGNIKAPLDLKLQGSTLLNFVDLQYSRLNIDGSLRISKAFKKQFSLINLLLPKKANDKGRYLFKLKGTLKNPQPSF